MPRTSRPPPPHHPAHRPVREKVAHAPTPTDVGPGHRVRGRFELHEIAGRGGMAVVWRATQLGDSGFARVVAVKQMHKHLAESQVYVDMFVEEARVLAAIASPNVAIIHDFIEEKRNYYLVMEWIDGIDLGTYVHHFIGTEQKTRWDLVAAVGIGMMHALAAAHERRGPDGQVAPVVHRDVSPHNILITSEGMVKLIDFGLSLARDRDKELTEPGIVKGKMSYLSPEIVGGQRPSPLSDQFAAGSVLWEALVGRKAFEGHNDYEIYKKLRGGEVQPLRPLRRDVPRELASVIHRALAADPAQRYPSAREMAGQLAQVLRSHNAPHTKAMYGLLAQSVQEARDAHARRIASSTPVTPIASVEPDSVTRPMPILTQASKPAGSRVPLPTDATPPEGIRRLPRRDDTVHPDGERKGLLHKLPFFWKR